MNKYVVSHRMVLGFCGILLGVLSLTSHADSPAPASVSAVAPASATAAGDVAYDPSQVLVLGDIKVTGQKVIIAVLQQMKAALNRPFDTSKEHENDIVCRISSDTGSRAREYLTCATNGQFARMRFAAQNKYLGAYSQRGSSGTMADQQLLLEHMVGQVPSHVLRVPLNKSKFDAMLHSIPDAPPDSAPAASTASGN